ncbi:hypothetical protein RRG08_007418 [Elysia crispata]|uniref:Uncharacterized protein n=1 Tax=Elysia crispata TaxID=231223 RepID=A0AAE0ZZ81_9GAST|nr:hypothetical protein RRG08_007418 [Elysia crispata]
MSCQDATRIYGLPPLTSPAKIQDLPPLRCPAKIQNNCQSRNVDEQYIYGTNSQGTCAGVRMKKSRVPASATDVPFSWPMRGR